MANCRGTNEHRLYGFTKVRKTQTTYAMHYSWVSADVGLEDVETDRIGKMVFLSAYPLNPLRFPLLPP